MLSSTKPSPHAAATSCVRSTSGPGRLPCRRTDPHLTGHVWVGNDVPDGRHDDS